MPEDLKVEDQQGEILVTIPGTAFSARYHKPDRQPILRLLTATVEPTANRDTVFKFRAEAFAAAMLKARKLGWM
jgi:hypothetical protein